MDNLIYTLFVCTVAPLILMLLLLQKRSKLIVSYMIIGIFVSLFVSELNTILLGLFNDDMLYVTTAITPISEEIAKAFPVLIFAVLFSNDRDKLLTIAFAAGIGFAMFENMVILVQNIESVSIGWAVIRGFSTALMHGVCTAAIGYGMSFVRKKKKLFYSGTFALLSLSCIYHGIFNMLVQSEYKYFGFILPAVTYIPVLVQVFKRRKSAVAEKSK